MEFKDCCTCKHSADAPDEAKTSDLFLVCRRATPSTDAQGRGVWPLVAAQDYCGQFEPDDQP